MPMDSSMGIETPDPPMESHHVFRSRDFQTHLLPTRICVDYALNNIGRVHSVDCETHPGGGYSTFCSSSDPPRGGIMKTESMALVAVLAVATVLLFVAPTDDVDAADQNVATVNGVTYATLEDAVEAAEDGDVVVLIGDVEVDEPITVDNSITLDLNDHTVINNVVAERAFIVAAPSFTIGGTDAGSSMVIPESNTGSYGFVKITVPSNVTIDGGTYEGDTDNGAFVKIFHNDSMDASGSTVTLNDATMRSNNGFFNTDTLFTDASTPTLIVNGGTYVSETKAFGVDTMYLSPITFTNVTVTSGTGPCIEASGSACTYIDCKFTVTGTNSNKFGTTAIAVSWMGTATIDGGTYTSTGYGAYVYSSGGTITIVDGTVKGGTAAVKADVDSNSYPGVTSTVIVEGGNTDGEWQTNNNDSASLVVMGGRHTFDVTPYLAEGYVLVGNLVLPEGYEETSETVSGDNSSASVETTDDTVTVVATEEVKDASVTATLQPSGTGSSSDVAGPQMEIAYNGNIPAGGLTLSVSRVDASTMPSVSTDNLAGLFQIDVAGSSDDFTAKVTISIDVPSGSYISNAWIVYYPDDDGEPELYRATVDGDTISFDTDHFSLWGFYAEVQKMPIIWDDDDDEYVPPIVPSQTDDSGDDNTTTIVACAAAAVVAALMAIFLIIERRH